MHFLSNTTYSNRLKECLNNYSLKQHITEPTNISYTGHQSLIDLVISNESYIDCQIHAPLIGNHSLIQYIHLVRRKEIIDVSGFKNDLKERNRRYN